MTATPLVSVVIPACNLWELTRGCLESLGEHSPHGILEVIVVDNGSTDATVGDLEPLGRALFNAHSDALFRVVRLPENAGFAVASNLGAAQARAERLLFLNNDTRVTPGWLPPLLRALDADTRLGAVGPLLLYPDTDRVQHCGIAFTPSLATEHLYANFPSAHPAVATPRPLQAITGAALLLERGGFARCGGFHEGYRNGSEDLELCWRLKEQGRKVACVPESRVYHLESRTPGRRDHDAANAARLNRRCSGCFAPDLHRLARRDGFELALTPWLETYLTLPAVRTAELTAAHTDFDPGRCWQTLQAEPLWQPGYELLAAFLEAHGRHTEASGVRLLHCYFFPGLPGYRRLALTAAQAGNAELAGQAARKVEHVSGLLEDPEPLVRKARGLARWARRAGERHVGALYEGWLADLGLPPEDDDPPHHNGDADPENEGQGTA